MPTSRLLIFGAAAILAASTAAADTFYVDDSGSDTNAGTFAAPFKTITKGLSLLDGAGDILYVRGGTYAESLWIENKNGSSGSEIRIAGYNGERPVIDATNVNPNSTTVSINTSSYLHFTGFVVKNSPKNGIKVWNSHHVNIEQNTVTTSAGYGIHAGSDVFGTTHDILIRGNVVSDTVRSNVAGTSSSGWVQAVSSFKADYVTITGNQVYENYGEGIDCILSDHCTITGNTVWDNFGTNVYLDNAQYALVDGNFIYNTGNPQYFRGGEPSPGITVANETYTGGFQNPANYLTITNNIVVRCKSGFVYYNSDEGGGLHNTLIANNTFYQSYSSAYRLIYIEADSHDTTIVSNNIFYQRYDVGYAWAPTTGFTWRTNNWYGGRADTEIDGTNDVLQDPKLVYPGGVTPADYKLKDDSPLRTTGTTESGVSKDYFGTTRTSSYSIGAHEH